MAMILAGGEGRRLFPLTQERAKPAVPFGAKYRIIDFVLNNFINSEIYRIKILTQFKSDSLNKHVSRGWPMSPIYGHYIDLVPAQMRMGDSWFVGTADAIHQNLNLIHDDQPEKVCVFGSDHIYKMDIRQMVHFHDAHQAELTIAAIPVPVDKASAFGIIRMDEGYRVIGFEEKPDQPSEIPGQPGWCLASMGNYVFEAETLVEVVAKDALDESSQHDFGRNIIIKMITEGRRVYVYDFHTNVIPGATDVERGYWRDVGDLDAYWEANMDLVSITPIINIYNPQWPIRTYSYQAPPTKYVHNDADRIGFATESIVSDGCIISGGRISRSVLSPYVRVNSYAVIEDSIIMHGVKIGRYAKLKKVIVDKNVSLPAGVEIGFDRTADEARGFFVSPGGVTVVPKGTVIDPPAESDYLPQPQDLSLN